MFRKAHQGAESEHLHDNQFEFSQAFLARERRMLFLRGPLFGANFGPMSRADSFSPTMIGDDILSMNIDDPKAPIYLTIDSPGGDVGAGMILYDLIRMSRAPIITVAQNCVSPGTKILTGDLRWAQAGDLRVGDELWGFDEYARYGGKRRWAKTTVNSVAVRPLRMFDVETDDGTVQRVTGDHRFRAETSLDRGWIRADQITAGRTRLLKYLHPWTTGTGYESGYLAGFLDGEGSVTRPGGHGLRVSFSQNEGDVFTAVRKALEARGFSVHTHRQGKALIGVINGGAGETLRLLGHVRPRRLLERASLNGKALYSVSKPRVVSVRDVGVGPAVVMETGAATFFTDGFGSHNCASMATVLMAAGHERVMYPHSRVMLHLPKGAFEGDSETFEIRSKELGRVRDELVECYVECGVTANLVSKSGRRPAKAKVRAQIIKDINRSEFWMTADECVAYGLVDRIATRADILGEVRK